MRPRGAIFYEGPSQLDGQRIIAIATRGTTNRKTGDLIQTWIELADVSPVEAYHRDLDTAICGDCIHVGRGDAVRTCYVNLGQAPNNVWKAAKRGSYPRMGLLEFAQEDPVRAGAHGDPAAVPFEFWAGANIKTGYTHQWRQPFAQPYKRFCMASCDSLHDTLDAVELGWRAFQVRSVEGLGATLGLECLSDSHGVQCADCGLCAGNTHQNAPSVWITAHGTAKRFVGA